MPGIFEVPFQVAHFVFIPLIGLCMVLGFTAIFTSKEIRDLSGKMYLLYLLIGIGIIIVFSLASLLLLSLGILLFIFITALFTLWSCYEKGVSWDEKIYKWPSPINHIARWLQYLILPTVGGLLILLAALAGVVWAVISLEMAFIFAIAGWILVGVCGFLWFLSAWFIFAGKLNSWLGIFFMWVAFYTWYLMFKAFISISLEVDPSGGAIGGDLMIFIQIGLYIFDMLIILSVIGNLVGERSEKISKTLHIKAETFFVWLIFSKAAYEYMNTIPQLQVGTLKAVLGFILFVPLVFITGLFGIINYFKVKKGMKKRKNKKDEEKKLEKKGIKCEECGNYNRQDAKFCKKCGKALNS